MKMTENKLVEKKIDKAGRELWLVETADGKRILQMPRPGGKEKVRVELLKQLRGLAALAKDYQGKEMIVLRGVRSLEDSILLEFDFIQEWWGLWEAGLVEKLTPEEAVCFLRNVLKILEEIEPDTFPIHPSDLIKLDDGELGLLDPRIGAVMEDADPVQPGRELCLPPEVVQGKAWTERSILYTAGLTAYSKLAGFFPFGSAELSEAAAAALQETPLDVRCHTVEVSEGLARLLQAVLEKKPERRPDLAEFRLGLDEAEKAGLKADPEAQAVFTSKIDALKQNQIRARKAKRLWRAGRWAAVAAVMIGAFIFLAKPGYDPKITRHTPPAKVVRQFYTAYADLDVQSMQETLHKTGQDIVQMVSIKFVLSRYTPDIQARKVLQFKDLTLTTVSERPNEARYNADYQLILFSGLGKTVQKHRDSLTLRPVKGVWRIVDYQSVLEKERFYRDPKVPRDRVDKASGLR